MGHTFESLPAFGRDVLEKLWDKDKSLFPYYSSILSENFYPNMCKWLHLKTRYSKKLPRLLRILISSMHQHSSISSVQV